MIHVILIIVLDMEKKQLKQKSSKTIRCASTDFVISYFIGHTYLTEQLNQTKQGQTIIHQT